VRRFDRVDELRAELALHRREARRIGFVPTMGALHEGHLSLIRECARISDVIVTSIFVNPLQFGPSEDFSKYPRDPDRDVERAHVAGSTIFFVPPVKEMYPFHQAVEVRAGSAGARWEGEARPGHFNGVLTVVAKLLNIVGPDVTVFGQKDFQQALLVQQMVRDLNFPGSVVVCPTVRDTDGLALSSRNAYLDAEARTIAAAIPRALATLLLAFQDGEVRAESLDAVARGVLEEGGAPEPQYLAIVDRETLEPVARATAGTVVLIAVRIGGTRLIDNVVLGERMPEGLEAALQKSH
jgi:pantoate--beta-alanine ligase